MRHDKKAIQGEIRFVVLERLGRASLSTASSALVERVLLARTP